MNILVSRPAALPGGGRGRECGDAFRHSPLLCFQVGDSRLQGHVLHAEQPAVDGADDVPGEVGVLLEVGRGLESQGREECGHQPCERLACEHVRVQRERAEENRDRVVPREELLLDVGRGGGQALYLEVWVRLVVDANRPADAGSDRAVCCGGGAGGSLVRVHVSDEEVRRNPCTVHVRDGE